jgi:hypothetical protein
MAAKAAKGNSPMSDLDKFGAETRAWLGANCPSD